MAFRSTIRIEGHWDGATSAVVVEPWAVEYLLEPGEDAVIVASHPTAPPGFRVQPCAGGIIVRIDAPGSSYEFRREAEALSARGGTTD